MRKTQVLEALLIVGAALVALSACSNSGQSGNESSGGTAGTAATAGSVASGGSAATSGASSASAGHTSGGTTASGGNSGSGGTTPSGGSSGRSGTSGVGGSSPSGGAGGQTSGTPAGWLYTNGNHVYVADGNGSGMPWVGRGVNIDDIHLCGYNNTLWMPAGGQTLETIVSGLMNDYKPTFVRISLSMASYDSVSWLSNPAQYATPMTSVINAIGAHPNTYVLVSLRSDGSMIGQDTVDGDPEATGIPSDTSTTPNAAMYPTGTDAVYVALVNSFAHAKFVLFGLTNEPGGNKATNARLASAMTHAVGVIRAEENRLGVPHHIVAVQGNGWTSDIGFYATSPLAFDNVVYEVHGYPPATASYTFTNLPVILGEYGSLTSGSATGFYADLEAKQIPSLAWDFEPFSNCAPDLVNVTHDASTLTPTPWGSIVQSYLLAHAVP